MNALRSPRLKKPSRLSRRTLGHGHLYALRGPITTGAPQSLALGPVAGLQRFLALNRWIAFWMRPVFGRTEAAIPQETQCLLCACKQGYTLYLPLVSSHTRAFLRGASDSVELVVEGDSSAENPVLFVATGQEPYALLASSIALLADTLHSFRPRSAKTNPAWIQYLSWCTWNAFYQNVDQKKILSGIRTLQDSGVPLRSVILDDGWQDIAQHSGDNKATTGRLQSFNAHPRKFPKGLAPVIEQAKKNLGIEIFGVWHTLQGYWHGIDPEGALAAQYRLTRANHVAWRTPDTHSALRIGVHPEEALAFFHAWHERLREQGVDMVKVDYQSGLEHFSRGNFPDVRAQQLFQQALQSSTQMHFRGNSLHCMCHGNDVFFNLLAAQVVRNSDDFYPDKPESHTAHIATNAFNNVFTGQFCTPDWDVFESGHAHAAYHAKARALSGGPIYFSDKPGKHNPDLLQKLAAEEGLALRFPLPALPAPSCLFTDCEQENRLLKITNHRAGVGCIGLFHCRYPRAEDIADRVTPRDIPGLRGTRFACFCAEDGSLQTVSGRQSLKVTVSPFSARILTFSPIWQNLVAPLGLVDKFAPAAGLISQEPLVDQLLRCVVHGNGIAGFWSARKPRSILVNGKPAKAGYSAATRLLRVNLRREGTSTIILRY